MVLSNNSSSFPNVTEEFRKRYLKKLREAEMPEWRPTVVFLLVVASLGLVGNSLVLFVYTKTRHIRRDALGVLVMAIAICDLLTNVLATPATLYKIFTLFETEFEWQCQLQYYLKAFTNVTSILFLQAVAICRYIKICTFRKEPSVRCAAIACVAISIFTGISLYPMWHIFHAVKTPTKIPGIYERQCYVDPGMKRNVWILLYAVLMTTAFVVVLVSHITLYILIIKKAWSHSKIHGVPTNEPTSSKSKAIPTKTKCKDTDEDPSWLLRVLGFFKLMHDDDASSHTSSFDRRIKHGSAVDVVNAIKTNESIDEDDHTLETDVTLGTDVTPGNSRSSCKGVTCHEYERFANSTSLQEPKRSYVAISIPNQPETRDKLEIFHSKSTTLISVKGKKRGPRKWNTRTTFTIIISVVYIISLLPVIVIILWDVSTAGFYEGLGWEGRVAYHLFVRFYFTNSCANAYIYILCDKNFRKALVKILCSCRKRHRSNSRVRKGA